jgi:O-acetyl-ADP-ribose deacetylase (regulator of RNase III)
LKTTWILRTGTQLPQIYNARGILKNKTYGPEIRNWRSPIRRGNSSGKYANGHGLKRAPLALCYDGREMTAGNKPTNDPLVKIHIFVGDLTESDADAIVNAANNDLQLGGGVAGAIRRKGGDTIQGECDEIGSIPIGGAAITGAGNLRAKHVIHAASMQFGGRATAQALRSATAHSLRIASENGLASIAFPAVGTGIAGFPLRECAEIMLRETAKHLSSATSLERVDFILFDAAALKVFQEMFRALEAEYAKNSGSAGAAGSQ